MAQTNKFPIIPRDHSPRRQALMEITDRQLQLLGWQDSTNRQYLAYHFKGATSRLHLSDRNLEDFSYQLAANIAAIDGHSLLLALSL